MKKWKGLLVREWFLMRAWVYVSVVIGLTITFVLPISLVLYEGSYREVLSDGFTPFTPIWLLFVLFTPSIILMTSIGKESTRPDIWLHSPASIHQLFGAKTVFAIFTGFVNVLVSFFVLNVIFSLQLRPFEFIYNLDTAKFWLLFLSGMFFISLITLSIVLFFRVVYLVIRPVTKKLAGAITLGSLLLFVWLVNKLVTTPFYEKISSMGEFGAIPEWELPLKGSASFYIAGDLFYVGEIILSIGFIGLLFIGAGVLFEKKVRL